MVGVCIDAWAAGCGWSSTSQLGVEDHVLLACAPIPTVPSHLQLSHAVVRAHERWPGAYQLWDAPATVAFIFITCVSSSRTRKPEPGQSW